MRSFMIYHILLDDQLKEEEMGRARIMCGVEDTCIQDYGGEKSRKQTTLKILA